MDRSNLGQPSGGWPLALRCLNQFMDPKVIKNLENKAKGILFSKSVRTCKLLLLRFLYLLPIGDILRYFVIPLPNNFILSVIRDM